MRTNPQDGPDARDLRLVADAHAFSARAEKASAWATATRVALSLYRQQIEAADAAINCPVWNPFAYMRLTRRASDLGHQAIGAFAVAKALRTESARLPRHVRERATEERAS